MPLRRDLRPVDQDVRSADVVGVQRHPDRLGHPEVPGCLVSQQTAEQTRDVLMAQVGGGERAQDSVEELDARGVRREA
ncbi:hypothetical protein Pen02_48220 [Plantactinospora endophytica]|uniref:Uncharacterized protein n=1 Tax=Plantactinospora endophytica TaxID=673535 RepID=A0ABQ4E5B4_9ACTN|nr:hypothetical protein Pen02_48220 [Plantactinospora endophytica]